MLLKLSRVGPGQSLDGRPDAAGRGVGGPVGGTLSIGLKNIPMPQGSDWGHWGHIYIYIVLIHSYIDLCVLGKLTSKEISQDLKKLL